MIDWEQKYKRLLRKFRCISCQLDAIQEVLDQNDLTTSTTTTTTAAPTTTTTSSTTTTTTAP